MLDEVVNYLESNRELVIKIDSSDLVDTAIKAWNFIKEDFREQYNKKLVSPEIQFDTTNLEYLQANLVWDKESYYLRIEVVENMSYCYIYFEDNVERVTLDKWYTLNTPLPDWLINKLSLFIY